MKGNTSLRLRGGIWYGNWRDKNKKRHEKALGPDKRVAARLLARLKENSLRAKHGLEDELLQETPLDRIAKAWSEHLTQEGRSARHVHDSRVGVELVIEAMDVRQACEVTPEALLRARGKLLATPPKKEKQRGFSEPRSHRTVNKLLGYMVACLRWAEGAGHIARATVTRAPTLSEERKFLRRIRHRCTRNEAAVLVGAAGAFADLVATGFGTGFRLEELLLLEWRDFQEGSKLEVRKSKNGDPRTNPLPADVAERLKARHKRYGTTRGRPDQRIFPYGESSASRALKAIRAKAGLPAKYADGSVIDWHALRHTYCTWLREAGVDLGTAAALMGHRSLKMVQEVYSDLSLLPKGAAIAKLDALMVAPRRQESEQG